MAANPMSAIYTIGPSGVGVTVWKNSADYVTLYGPDAPREGEPFMLLFTEPWMADRYLRNTTQDPDVGVYRIDSQAAWSLCRARATEIHGAQRAIVNDCMPELLHAETFAQVRELDFGSGSFDAFVGATLNSACPDCYREPPAAANSDTPIKVFPDEFSEPQSPEPTRLSSSDENSQPPQKSAESWRASFNESGADEWISVDRYL